MSNVSRSLLITITTVLLLSVIGGAVAGAGAAQEEVTVTLEPAEQTIDPAEETTYKVVVNGATDGIKGYDLAIGINDPGVATFTDFEHEHNPDFPAEEVTDDEVVVSAGMGLNQIDGADKIVLGTITVVGEAEGNTELVVGSQDNPEISDKNDNQYSPVGTVDGAVEVTAETPDPAFSINSTTLAPGENGEITLSGEDIENGLSSFETTLRFTDGAIASVQDVSVPGDDSPVVNQDGNTVTVEATPGRDGTNIDLATFTVAAEELGKTDVEFESMSATDADGNAYGIRSLTNGSVVVESDGNSVDLDLRPADPEVPAGSNTTVDVVVEGAGNGIEAYDLSVSLNDTAVGVFTDAVPDKPNAGQADVTVEDGSVVISHALFDDTYGPAEEITVATLTVATEDTPGAALKASIDSGGVQDVDGNQYDVTTTDPGTIQLLEGPPAIVGDNPPQDLNGDGLYRDIDGNGEANIFDVQTLFTEKNRINEEFPDATKFFNFAEQNPDEVTVFDVQSLFGDI